VAVIWRADMVIAFIGLGFMSIGLSVLVGYLLERALERWRPGS
jgi:hypothetical protein